MKLPDGVRLRELTPHDDDRGRFTELHRGSWDIGVDRPAQWNAVRSQPGVLRGVHCHGRHDDYLTVVAGKVAVGLRDLRDGSPTEGLACCVTMDADAPSGLSIPHGVAHGFLFLTEAIHVYAVTHEFDPTDELGCRWDDPALEIPWPGAPERISPRDEGLPSLAVLLDALQRQRATGDRLDGLGTARP